MVDGLYRSQDLQRSPVLSRSELKRLDVLGKTRSAVTCPRIEKLIADTWIGADALAHMFDIGAQLVGKVRHLVHKRNARREHRVGRVLGQFRRAHIHYQEPLAIALEWRVHRPQERNRTFIVGADHHAIRLHEVVDGGPFLQELRIRRDSEGKAQATLRQRFSDALTDPIRRSHRDRGFIDDHLVARHALADISRGGEDMAHVRGPILVGRRADCDELQNPVRDRSVGIGREFEPPRFDVARDHVRQVGLVNGHAAVLQDGNLARINVEPQHVVADLRQAGAGHQTDVSGANHGDLHVDARIARLISRSCASGSDAWVIGLPITR